MPGKHLVRQIKLTCKEASHLLSQGQDRALGLGERVKLRLHLLICDACANFSRQVATLRRAMQALRERSGPDPRS
ncbi:MAG: zf-HC2 domain-containing protein [Betaproteobacteria bacterium]